MRLTKLGLYIEQSDARNIKGKYGENSVVGLSTQKEIIKTKADLSGVNLRTYKLFPPMSFAYVPDTSRRGDKVSLAFNMSKNVYLVSSIYTVFFVSNKILNPWYLYIFFNRPEFDRYCRFNSWGSARETFNWEDMCDIEITLPDLPTQQKYVNIYKSLLANQQCYERGMEDLAFTFNAIIEKEKHKAPRKSIGTFLSEIDNRNTKGIITNVQGININKQFMPSVANTTDVSLNKYKLVQKGQFAFSGMQTGRDECIHIALYNGNAPIIISPAYTVLQTKDNSILPEYIMMWFSRKESDRLGWFYSDGSIRSNLDLDRFLETKIPVPDFETQRSIVDIYNSYVIRREINEKLKEQIKNICPILIKGSLEETGIKR